MTRPDGRGRRLELVAPPRRIVSLVPSTTATLFDLGVGDRVVGVTRFCVEPEQAKHRPKVGGTKDVDPSRVAALEPDLIFANCEENTRDILDAMDRIAPVWAPLPRTVDQALMDIEDTGRLCGVPDRARDLLRAIEALRTNLHAMRTGRFTYAALIWRKPWMSASNDTFLASMVSEARGTNVFGGLQDRFPVIELSDLTRADPDRILLLSEPFPFKERHKDELIEATGLPPVRFLFVDGRHLTWHGSTMAASMGGTLLHLARYGGYP